MKQLIRLAFLSLMILGINSCDNTKIVEPTQLLPPRTSTSLCRNMYTLLNIEFDTMKTLPRIATTGLDATDSITVGMVKMKIRNETQNVLRINQTVGTVAQPLTTSNAPIVIEKQFVPVTDHTYILIPPGATIDYEYVVTQNEHTPENVYAIDLLIENTNTQETCGSVFWVNQ
jgi:hypothetical protein